MNKFVRLLFLVLSLFLALYLEGVMKGAQSLSRARASEVLVVVDQDGRPVPAARIQGGFRTGDGMRDNIPVKGLTEANGEFHVSGSSVDRLSVRVIKEGYYPTDLILDYRERSRVEDKCWQPYGTRRTVVLKRQVNPGRLVVFPRELRDLRIPKKDVWMGFDLELHDWIRPWGRGVHDDVLFCFHEDEKREGVRFSDCLQMSFTNNPFAGAYVMQKDAGSGFYTSFTADDKNCFKADFSYRMAYLEGKGKVFDILGPDAYLVFRTRTRVDEKGRLASAHYGVISGPLYFDQNGLTLSDGCFNPVPNDLNIEDGREFRRHYGPRQGKMPE